MNKNVHWSHVNYRLFLSDFNESWIFFYRFSTKHPNIKFHENPSSGTRDVACGQSDGGMDRQTYRLDEADIRFRNFANAPKKAQRSGVAPHRHMTTQRHVLQLNSVPIVGSDETELRSMATRSIDIRLSSFHWYVLARTACVTRNQAYGRHFSCGPASEIHNWTPISVIRIWRSGIPCGWFAMDYLTITGQSINEQSHS
jgi:hypothetical protein